MSKTTIFFVTDVHGSDVCFRKFINAGKFYGANVLVLGGDITGKMIIPIVEQDDGTHKCTLFGNDMTLKSHEQVEDTVKTIRNAGAYPYVTGRKEFQELQAKPDSVKRLFTKLMVEGIRRWMKLAEERLDHSGIGCYISPGNDDIIEIDEALDSSTYVVNPEEKVVDIGGNEMITLGYANHTPWNSPREVDEEVLEQKIEKMCANVKDMRKTIFNLHVPPIDTIIDQAPMLDETLKPALKGGHIQMISAGSIATRKMIEKYSPLIGLHGHIHESKGVERVGKTMCFNPGSEYGSGILRGLICQIEGDKIKSHLLTSG
ncbi:MAG: metallophosphoesterase [Nitrososphaerota archaeon]|nr:metallophosphoesterase [Nitrososphaerota archaeon]